MKLTTKQKWVKTIAWLRRNFPAGSPIAVQSTLLEEQGCVEYAEARFHIKINRKQSFNLKVDALIHEWAHILVWHGAEAQEDHSSEWGIAYAKIYRTFLEWNWGEEFKGEEDA